MVCAVLWMLCVYMAARIITGPFIFGDESTYFSFARELFGGNNINVFTQYGPLYPLIISPFFSLDSVIQTYHLIRISNILLCATAVIPAYFLAKSLFDNPHLQKILTFCVLVTPFSGFSHLVWAEPLYIVLFYWTCYFVFHFFKKANLVNSCTLGLLLASLYYAKPGAGLAIQCAAFLTLFCYSFAIYKSKQSKLYLFVCLVMLICISVDLPWILHYRHLGLSIVGYPQSTQELEIHVSQWGYFRVLMNILCSFFYQLSYFFIGSWGLIGVYGTLLIMEWAHLKENEKYFYLFIVFSVMVLITLCALGMSTNSVLDYRMPNGRYFGFLFPLIVTITLDLFLKEKISNWHWRLLIAVLAGFTLLCIIASPLYTLNPVAYTTMPELSLIIYIANQGLVNWGPLIEAPTMLLRFAVPILFGGFGFFTLLYIKHSGKVLLASVFIFLGFLFSALAAHYYVIKIGHSQSPFNNIYVYFLKRHIDVKNVVFDKKMENGNVQSMTPFWFNGAPIYSTLTELIDKNHYKSVYFVSMDKLERPILFTTQAVSVYKIEKKINHERG